METFTTIERPNIFISIWFHLDRTEGSDTVFKTILSQKLGEGFFYNTIGTRAQFAYALAFSGHPLTQYLSSDFLKEMQRNKVLRGLKILDMGCGVLPSFALAAKAFGAKVYTTDAKSLHPKHMDKIDGHVSIDLNSPDSAANLLQATGGGFDLVTENIIDTVPLADPRSLSAPSLQTLKSIAATLLRNGGIFYSNEALFKPMLLERIHATDHGLT